MKNRNNVTNINSLKAMQQLKTAAREYIDAKYMPYMTGVFEEMLEQTVRDKPDMFAVEMRLAAAFAEAHALGEEFERFEQSVLIFNQELDQDGLLPGPQRKAE